MAAASGAPRYLRIAETMRQRIARGIWPSGGVLPANEALAVEFGVSRVTIRQAVAILVREDLLQARQGCGTYVTGVPAPEHWLRVETSLAALDAVYRDTTPEMVTIAEEPAEAPLHPEDGVAAAHYIHMQRVHSRQGRPYCVISIYLNEEVFRQCPERFRRELVIPILTGLDQPKIAHARQSVTITSADLDASDHLGISLGSPVGEVRRVFCGSDGTVHYLAEVTYRADVVRIEMDLKP